MNDLSIARPDQFAGLRAEAAVEPDAPAAGPARKETQIIAIYGKGGIGKSFTLANLSYSMAQNGKRVLLIGCDPKSDTTSLLFGGKACPTIIQTSSAKKLAGEEVAIGDVCFVREARFRTAAEWKPADMAAVLALVEAGRLSLDGIVTHRAPAAACAAAYRTAFGDSGCLKMILDWSDMR